MVRMNEIVRPFDEWDEEDKEYFHKLMAAVPPAVDFMAKYCNDARWDCVSDAMRVLKEGFKDRKEEII